MYLAQIWFNLSDEDVEDAIYDSYYLETRAERLNPRRTFPEKPAPCIKIISLFQTNIIRTRFSKLEIGSDFFLPSTTMILKTADGEGLLPSAERDHPP